MFYLKLFLTVAVVVPNSIFIYFADSYISSRGFNFLMVTRKERIHTINFGIDISFIWLTLKNN